jgi:hypothetical protein
LFISRPNCSYVVPFLLSEAQDLITEVNNSGKGEEGKAELILEDTPTVMTIADMKLVALICPSR